MKLDNRGWGLQTMMIFTLILMIALVITSSLINSNFGDLTKEKREVYDHSKLENEVVEAAKKYINNKNITIEKNDTYTVTVSKLKEEKLINDLRDDYSKCSGYVIVNNSNSMSYKAYIKCGNNYKTSNYSSNLDY